MSLMFQPFKKYATFTGRARRSEYWLFFLLYIIVYTVALVVAGAMATGAEPTRAMALPGLVLLAFFLPSLAVAVRRLHDVDKSGWWLLIGAIPLVGLILLYWFVQPGATSANRFGEDPKGASAEVFA